MARPIWKGQISFGLVNVPVTVYPAEQRADLSFHLLDSRDSSRVRYQRVNEATGEEVPWDQIVKGYEYDGGNYVFLTDEDLQGASPELTKMVEIEQFVELKGIDVRYFDKPYYLEPGKGGEKGYVLLREAMQATGKVGIANVVIRARGHLAALIPQGSALVLELLRYQQELRDVDQFDVPAGDLKEYKITKKELDLAKQLVEGMAAEWRPEQFHDEYRDALMKLIEQRIKSGETEEVVHEEAAAPEAPRTTDFMAVLKKSLEQSKSATRTSARKQRPAKKKAV